MNLYLLSQSDNTGYDTYDSCIVAAPTEEQARLITPYGGPWTKYTTYTWANEPENVTVQLIGIATHDIQQGVVLSSFNAG